MDTEAARILRNVVIGGLFLAMTMIALVLALLSTDAISAGGLVDPGALVRWGLPVVTTLSRAAAAVTIGAFAAASFLISPTAAPAAWRGALTVGRIAAVVWAVAQVLFLFLGYASIWGRPLDSPNFGGELLVFIRGTELGLNYFWAAALALLVSLFAVAAASMTMAMWTLALGMIAFVPIALTGHAAGAVAHNLAVSSMWLHIAPVALWVGGLLVLIVVLRGLGTQLVPAVQRYSRMATWCYAVVALSGVLAGAIRLDSPAELLTTPWGRVLTAKMVLFAGLGLLGWWHRRRTIPRLDDSPRLFWRVAAGEVLVMAAVMGLAVALSSSPPPVPQEPVVDPSAVFALSGYPEPPYPTVLTWFTQWHFDPLYFIGASSAVGVYLLWVRRLRARDIAWSPWRTFSWVTAWIVFAWVTMGGPQVYGLVLFSSHMVMHMLLVMGIPVLFALAAPVTLGLRAVPPRRDGSRGPREWVLALIHSRWARVWSHPIVTGVNFAGSLFLFYYTDLLPLAMSSHVGHVLMVIHFSLAGYLFANAIIGIDPGVERPYYPVRLVLLFAAMIFHAFFGLSLISYSSLLGADYFGRLGLSWWVDALADQEYGGLVTWGIGEAPTLILAILIALAWIRDDAREAKRLDRVADRTNDAELEAYNRMLAARAGAAPPDTASGASSGESSEGAPPSASSSPHSPI